MTHTHFQRGALEPVPLSLLGKPIRLEVRQWEDRRREECNFKMIKFLGEQHPKG